MKLNKIKNQHIFIIRIAFAVIAAIAGGVVIRYCFPNLLYNSLGYVSESKDQTKDYVYSSDVAQIEFQPQNNYIDNIWLYVYDYSVDEEILYPKIQISVLNSYGRKICEDYYWLLVDSSYIKIPVRKNLNKNQNYTIQLKMPDDIKVAIKTCPGEDVIEEEKKFVYDGVEDGTKCFINIYYGNYSKKLLIVWCGVFALGSLFLTELIEKKEQ